ncbi:MAG: phospholipid/cholesterol/gamma-HCH transport system substrate-binding protein [Lysobacterales bacterium]|jgi:phospholipid/cholesterol/gamma-HCH transport system substrate-binding protein
MVINKETKIGIMITLVLIGLGVLTIRSGDFAFKGEGYEVKVRFHDVDGVNLNSPVMFNGFEVGAVHDIQIIEENDTTLMELSITIKSGVVLREGATANIKNLGFMGEKYVGITSGSIGAPLLPNGATIIGTDPQSIDALLKDAKDIATSVKSIAKNVDERLTTNKEHIDHIFTNMDTTMTKMSSVADSVDERLEVNKIKIDAMVTNLHDLSVHLEEMSQDLKSNPWKLLHKP